MARMLMVAPDEALLKALRASPLLEAHAIEVAAGDAAAIRRLRQQAIDVLVTAPDSDLDEDTAILDEVRLVRPGRADRAPRAAHDPRARDRRAAASGSSRASAPPSTPPEIADMVARAAEADDWKDGIEVLSATPDWMHVRVNCRLLSAERLVNFLTELRSDVPEAPRDDFMFAFREVLMNAMEHGGGFDPDQVVEVTAVRTASARWSSTCATPAPASTSSSLPTPRSRGPTTPSPWPSSRGEGGPAPGGLRPAAHAAGRGRDALQRARQRGHPHQAPAVSPWRTEWLRRGTLARDMIRPPRPAAGREAIFKEPKCHADHGDDHGPRADRGGRRPPAL